MAVHFVYRSHYDNPGCFHRKRFEADSLLSWFQSIWQGVPHQQPDWAGLKLAEQLVGRDVYSFGSLFGHIHEHGWRAPKSMKVLAGHLEEALYVNEMTHGPHHVQILTDDDELEMAIYLFDDEYVAKHPDRAAFLMGDGWRLPDGGKFGEFKPSGGKKVLPGAVAGDGRTYFAHFAAYDGGGLSDLTPGEMTGVIEGVRVPDLPRFFLTPEVTSAHDECDLHNSLSEVVSGLAPALRTAKGTEVPLLKAVRANPNDTACWAAYSDWCEENGRPTLLERILAKSLAPSGTIKDSRNPRKDVVLVQGHVAQACKHRARWNKTDSYHHLILFDDLWANAHPLLASGILRAGNRWDVL
jgi:uncharacterized protein (TIGR02996 family)